MNGEEKKVNQNESFLLLEKNPIGAIDGYINLLKKDTKSLFLLQLYVCRLFFFLFGFFYPCKHARASINIY